MSRTIDETGNRYGRLLVLKRSGSTTDGKAKWECLCDCGNTRTVSGKCLRNGDTQSCGCYNKEMTSKSRSKYAIKNTRLYHVWKDMIYRCERPKHKSYKHYGGRGIKVCEEWHDANKFFDWAASSGYKDDLTIDRIDYNGNYSPLNCRWTTMKEQLNNKRNNRWITIDGKTKTLQQWCEYYSIPRRIVQHRIESGIGCEEALTRTVPDGKQTKNSITRSR